VFQTQVLPGKKRGKQPKGHSTGQAPQPFAWQCESSDLILHSGFDFTKSEGRDQGALLPAEPAMDEDNADDQPLSYWFR
jgi:hypothetical protein